MLSSFSTQDVQFTILPTHQILTTKTKKNADPDQPRYFFHYNTALPNEQETTGSLKHIGFAYHFQYVYYS